MYNEGKKTFIAGEALAEKRNVRIKAGTITTPPEVVYADAGEDGIGVTEFAVAKDEPVTVKLWSDSGTFEVEVIVGAAINRGTELYSANDGKLCDTSTGSLVAVALEPGITGQQIEVYPQSKKSTTAALVSLLDSAGLTASATVEAVIAEILQGLKTTRNTIPVPLGAINMEDGTALTKQATTVAGIAQLADKEQVIMIPIGCTSGESLGFSVPLPQNIDIAADLTVHVLAGKGSDLDALTLDCEVFPVAAGDAANTDIQDTEAQAIVAAVSELVFTCGLDGLLASPSAITAILTLGGTNDGDDVYIYAVWIEYKSKILTS
jgi:hypothetical protein